MAKKIIALSVLSLIFFNPFMSNASEKVSMAVLDLEANNVPKTTANTVTGLVQQELFKTGRFALMDRKNMESILKEQAFEMSGCTAAECAVKAGQILGVSNIVIGSLGRLGMKYIVNVSLIDVEKSQIVAADSVQCSSEDDLDQAASEIALKIGMKIPMIGKVIDVDMAKKIVYIDLGSQDNIINGTKLSILRIKREIRNSQGKVVMREKENIAKISVAEVDKEASRANIDDKETDVIVGDIVQMSPEEMERLSQLTRSTVVGHTYTPPAYVTKEGAENAYSSNTELSSEPAEKVPGQVTELGLWYISEYISNTDASKWKAYRWDIYSDFYASNYFDTLVSFEGFKFDNGFNNSSYVGSLNRFIFDNGATTNAITTDNTKAYYFYRMSDGSTLFIPRDFGASQLQLGLVLRINLYNEIVTPRIFIGFDMDVESETTNDTEITIDTQNYFLYGLNYGVGLVSTIGDTLRLSWDLTLRNWSGKYNNSDSYLTGSTYTSGLNQVLNTLKVELIFKDVGFGFGYRTTASKIELMNTETNTGIKWTSVINGDAATMFNFQFRF